jgi:4-hydroxy-3-polyprenylbenzoate decarboxylase
VRAPDLRSFLAEVDRAGELRRVTARVDSHLEITEICQRIVREEGPALLFENVEGADFPLAINLFGSRRRIAIALGGKEPAEAGGELLAMAGAFMPPEPGKILRAAPQLVRALGMRTRVRRGGAVREVEEAPDLTRLPVLTCWPEDGGPFVTFPLVVTRSLRDGTPNVGIYRMQVFGPDETGMHWQIGKGGGYHFHDAEGLGRPLPVTVALGGDPLVMMAAMMPLPEGLSEYAFAGLLRGKPVILSRSGGRAPDVPAGAEFALEGVVEPGVRRTEGPFGDHFGHYSAAASFPVFRVTRMTRRRDAIYPAIVVGKPPQEDGFLGNAVQELLGPLIRIPHPEIRDLWSWEATGFHHLLVASAEQRFTREAMRSAFGLLGQGQLGLTKVLLMVGPGVDPRNLDDVLEAIATDFDPSRDFMLLPRVPFDTLDFTSTTMNLGSKMILDATPGPGDADEARPAPTPDGLALVPDLTGVDRRIVGQALLGRAILVVRVEGENPREVLAKVLDALRGSESDADLVTPPKIVAAVSPDIPENNRDLLLWGIFTRFDPARDVFFEESSLRGAWPVHRGRMAIDATFKTGYPNPLEMSPEVVAKVDRRWREYFPA